MTPPPRILRSGDAAVTFELGSTIDSATCRRVQAFDSALQAAPFPGLRESVPTYRSLLVCFDPRQIAFEEVRERLGRLDPALDRAAAPRLHVIPTVYDGPDLPAVAAATGLSEAEVVALHSGGEYLAYMLGFTPGFAYLGDLPPRLHTARRATPRVRVPAGSVAIAGGQTGVYPFTSPGGWNLIGRTSTTFFEPRREAPALVAPGDRVRFEAVRDLPAAPAFDRGIVSGTPALEVLEPGLLTTVQDRGRFGHRRFGVSWAGAADRPAYESANRLVGNEAGAAALECTMTGPTLRFLQTTRFAVTGADLGAVLQRADLGDWPVPSGTSVLARSGNVLSFQGRRHGCRGYLALAGGIDVPLLMGSRATDLAGRFGGHEGRALQRGDRLALGAHHGPPSESAGAPVEAGATLRVILGPQDAMFTPEAVEQFLSSRYDVGPTSDRTGCRLAGPRLEHLGAAEIPSEGMLPGSIQVPPDGQPIVMLADCPTTGGYPKIATVVTDDLRLLAQLAPGEGRVAFRAVSA